MNRLFRILRSIFISIFCCFAILRPDGFVAGTLVKVPGGYAAIETLKIGSIVCCADRDAAVIERPVIAIATEAQPTEIMAVRAGRETLFTSPPRR